MQGVAATVRVAICLCAIALVAPKRAGAARTGSTYGAKPVCTTGKIRCMALLRTHNGRPMRAATPALLPAGFGPAQYHSAYGLPTQTPLVTGSTTAHRPVTVAVVDAWDYAYAYA